MNVQVQPHVTTTRRHLPFDCAALVSRKAAVPSRLRIYEALAEAGIHPDWIAGISIGATLPAMRRIPASIGYASFGPK